MNKVLFVACLVLAAISFGVCYAEAPTSEMLKSMSDEELRTLSAQIASSSSINSFFHGGLELFSGIVVFGVLLLIPAWLFGKGKLVATLTAMSFCMGLLFGLGNSLTMPEGLSQVKDEINQRQKSQIASTTTQPEKGNKNTQEKESPKVAEEKKNENGKPVTDDVLQSFRDSVTDDEMKKFFKIAKKYQYTESQVRDFVAKMKLVGVDFSVLKEGIPIPYGFRFYMSNHGRKSSEGNFCFATNECSVEVLTQKEDRLKIDTIFIHQRDQQSPLYTLYKDNNIIGDFPDVLLAPEASEKIRATVNDYISTRSGNIIESYLLYTPITVTKDAFSDESKWKGGPNTQFEFVIPYCYIRYAVPSEVYGEKEKEKYSKLCFNKHGELLLAIDYPLPKEDEYNMLLKQAVERVKL